jgi:hypothetical protein
MSDILSKVSASGLSAGVFLLWWPAHVASQGNGALLMRGVLWALAFEILLLGLRPLERALGRAVRTRDADVIAPRRIAPVLALAAVAAAVPITMLSGARAPIAAPARAAAPKVIVKREIVRREVVVRRVSHVVRVPVPAAAPAPTATAAPAPTTRTSAAAKPASAPKTKKATAHVVSSGTTADTKVDLPTSTVTTAKPAPTATTAQPVTTAPATTSPATPAAPAVPATKAAGG